MEYILDVDVWICSSEMFRIIDENIYMKRSNGGASVNEDGFVDHYS